MPDYEWRRKVKGVGIKKMPQPEWQGESLDGRTILLHAEQGLGDTLHFIRYAPLVKKLGARVLLAASAPLVPLLRRTPGIDEIVVEDTLVAGVDYHISLLSLPLRMGTTRETLPGDIPYIFPVEDRIAFWRDRLKSLTGLRVGLVWQGSFYHPEDRFRSIPLSRFEALSKVPGVTLIGLQVGTGREQIRLAQDKLDILDLGGELDQTSGALMDAAAVLKNLDLLISCDTAIAHLAGAMEVPVWVAVPFAPDWRWFLESETTAWYPSMRLFRAPAPAEWAQPIERLATALRERVGGA